MATYTRADVIVSVDNSGGTPQVMTQHTLEMSDLDLQALMDITDGLGDSYQEQQPGGLKLMSDITLTGLYDDTASTGPDAMYASGVGSTTTRTLTVTVGGSKTWSVECFIKQYKVMESRGKKTRYSVVLSPTGTITLA